MKKIIALALSLLMFLVPVSAFSGQPEGGSFSNARSIADFMETHYGITVLIGPECFSASTSYFSLGDASSPDESGGKNCEEAIRLVDDTFSVYPPGFFEHFVCRLAPNGLRILLPDRILYNRNLMGGTTTIGDGYLNIFLCVGGFNSLSIHHELWHAIEGRILNDRPDAFTTWKTLNPEGFMYNGDLFGSDVIEQDSPYYGFFVRGYSTANELEDRATVIEALFACDGEWWNAHPGVAGKYEMMMEAARPVFGEIYGSKEE